MPDITDHEK